MPFCHTQHHLGLSYEGEMSHTTIKSPREGDEEGNQLFAECRQAMGSWAGWGAAEPQGSGLSHGCLWTMSCHWPWGGSQITVSYVMAFAPCFYLKICIILRQVDLYWCYHPDRLGEATAGKLEEKLAEVAEGWLWLCHEGTWVKWC